MIYRLKKITHVRNSIVKVYLFQNNISTIRVFDERFGGRLYAGFDYKIDVVLASNNEYFLKGYEAIYEWNHETLPAILKFLLEDTQKADAMYRNQDNKILSTFLDESEEKRRVNVDSISSEFQELGKALNDFFSPSKNAISLKEVAYLMKSGVPTSYIEHGLLKNLNIHQIIELLYDIDFLTVRSMYVPFKKTESAAKRLGIDFLTDKRLKAAALHAFVHASNKVGHIFLTEKEFNRYAAEVVDIDKTKDYLTDWLQKTGGKSGYIEIGNGFFPINLNYLYKELAKPFYYISLFYINFKKLNQYFKELIFEGHIIKEERKKDDYVYYLNTDVHPFYYVEKAIAKSLIHHKREKRPFYDTAGDEIEITEEIVNNLLKNKGYELEDKQFEFVYQNVKEEGGVGYLNGGAGRGKTFTVSAFIQIYKVFNPDANFMLLAPTGRAAKQLEDSTATPANTLQSFVLKPKSEEVFTDVYIIDETSMVDMMLFYQFLNKIDTSSKVIVVGHDRQLESIGPGRIFADIIYSDAFDGVTLDVAKRFKKDSKIFDNAERILAHQMLYPYKDEKENEICILENDDEILDVLLEKLKKRQLEDPNFEETQILVPMYRGIVGINYLNYLIKRHVVGIEKESGQHILHSTFTQTVAGEEKQLEIVFNEGDKVVNVKNTEKYKYRLTTKGKRTKAKGESSKTYSAMNQKGTVMNGDIGTVIYVGYVNYKSEKEVVVFNDEEESEEQLVFGVVVRISDGNYFYPASEVKEYLNLAYAMSIHKSQGSEWNHTYLILSDNHRMMQRNNIMYTGFTRSKKYQCTLGTYNAIHYSIMNETKDERNTQLIERIHEFDKLYKKDHE